jgi:hypothetical protein
MGMKDSIEAEFAGAMFKDQRLSKRLVALATEISQEPASSFPTSLDEAELEGAYRFFSNKKVMPEKILKPHVERTLERIAGKPVTLALHDTTTLSFRNEGQRVGFGSLTGNSQHLWTHATLAVRGDGSRRPEGLLVVTTETEINHDRWFDSADKANALVGDPRLLVHVMDREADDYALFAKLVKTGARFVVRLQHDRQIDRAGVTDPAKITDALSGAELVAEREVLLSERTPVRGIKGKRVHPARKRRVAQLSIAAVSVEVKRPRTCVGDFPSELALNAIRAWEAAPPDGEPAVEWLLLTTEPITTVDDMLRVVDWYRARWVIEEFFKAMKTGCAIEKRQLETFAALGNAVAFFSPIAWQLLLLRHRARDEPTADGSTSLPPGMLHVLRHIARRPLVEHPTSLDVFLAVAALGGHLKRNGEPGWQTLARGYEKLRDATTVWELAVRSERSDQS